MEEIEFTRWLFEGRAKQGKNVLPDGLNWLCYFAGSSKSHRENSISCIFLDSPHQVDMKNVVMLQTLFLLFQCSKTHCGTDIVLNARMRASEKDLPVHGIHLECFFGTLFPNDS